MSDPPRPSRDQPQGTQPDRTPRTWGENTGERRRRRTLALVERRIAEIVDLLTARHPGHGVVGGAATCAEVRLDEQGATHRFIRIGLIATPATVETVVTSLQQEGWRRTVPGSDSGIIRMAHASGRRPQFIVVDGPGAADLLTGPGAPPATSPAGRRIRADRLRSAMVPPLAVLARREARSDETGTDIESLEIQIRSRATVDGEGLGS